MATTCYYLLFIYDHVVVVFIDVAFKYSKACVGGVIMCHNQAIMIQC